VKRAVAQVAKRGVRFLTIHASHQVMQAAAEGRASSTLQLLAVTVLTSVDQADLEQDGISKALPQLVELRVRNAVSVASTDCMLSAGSRERANHRRAEYSASHSGSAVGGAATGDQKRTATPAEAIRNGANYLVIGRQVTRAKRPAEEVARILREIKTEN
jgi:orotidine-5'-phosphate decarboxylase